MSVPGQPPGPPTTTGQGIAMARAGLAWLAVADVVALPTAVQAGHDALEEACHRWLPSCIMLGPAAVVF
jgi:hypothetical protein